MSGTDLFDSSELAGMPDPGRRPRHGRISVRRDGLLKALETISADQPLILLAAPAGYGKTTLLRQWAKEAGRTFGWLELQESDNDPAVLHQRVNGVLGRIQAPEPGSPSVTTRPGGWVLVLDDLHVLHDDRCLAAVAALADDVPSGCRLVVAGRSRPDVDRIRLGRHAEFGQKELGFTLDEVEVFAAEIGLPAAAEVATVLHERTGGWPAVTYLAALSIPAVPDETTSATTIRGDDAFIADYLRDEILNSVPAEISGFLLRTAPLEHLTAPLCDFVLGRSDSAARLAEVERHDLLRTAGQPGAYRYHGILSEMLRAELQRRQPGEDERVHRRAAAWYDAHAEPEPAVGHAFAGHDTATAAWLISRYADALLDEGQIGLLQDWLASLDSAAFENSPILAVQAGWIWATGGETTLALRSLLTAEQRTRIAGGSTPVIPGAASLRAALAPEGVTAMMRDARRAVGECRTEQEQAQAAGLLGVAYLLNGRTVDGMAELQTAVTLGRATAWREACFAAAQLSLAAAETGDWAAAADYAAEASLPVHRAGRPAYASGVAVQVAHAALAAHRGDPPAARDSLSRAERLYAQTSLDAFPWLGAQMAINLGRISLDLDDTAGAETSRVAAQRFLARLSDDGLLGDRYRSFASALDNRGEAGVMLLSTAEMRILHLLTTHLTLGEIAEKLYLSRNTVKTHVSAVYRKLNASTRAEAVDVGRTSGLITA
jgi:LuxR family maltose regulon positive regulatory protein